MESDAKMDLKAQKGREGCPQLMLGYSNFNQLKCSAAVSNTFSDHKYRIITDEFTRYHTALSSSSHIFKSNVLPFFAELSLFETSLAKINLVTQQENEP